MSYFTVLALHYLSPDILTSSKWAFDACAHMYVGVQTQIGTLWGTPKCPIWRGRGGILGDTGRTIWLSVLAKMGNLYWQIFIQPKSPISRDMKS